MALSSALTLKVRERNLPSLRSDNGRTGASLRDYPALLAHPTRVCYSPSFRDLNVLPSRGHMLTLSSIIQRDPEIIAAEADQDLIMVNVATGHYYGVSDVAREIWDAIEQPKRISDLVDDLTAIYHIGSSTCEEQTVFFLQALLDEGLLQVKHDGSGY